AGQGVSRIWGELYCNVLDGFLDYLRFHDLFEWLEGVRDHGRASKAPVTGHDDTLRLRRHAGDTCEPPPTSASPRHASRNVTGPVADQRHTPIPQGGADHPSGRSIGERLPMVVHNLCHAVLVEDVLPVVRFALTRKDYALREPVEVVDRAVEGSLEGVDLNVV